MILVTGANGVVGQPLIQKLLQRGDQLLSVSRAPMSHNDDNQPSLAQSALAQLKWDLNSELSEATALKLAGIQTLIHCAPIWLLPQHLPALADLGLKRVVVFSSTSVISKEASPNPHEQELVRLLSDSEDNIRTLCQRHNIGFTILRPSMIYGYGADQNISHIAAFIGKWGLMFLMGRATGLRQPVHADDLVWSALTVLEHEKALNQTYNLAGGEQLSYRTMVKRIFSGLGKKERIISLPLSLFRPALWLAKRLTKFNYTPEMANRMNQDLTYSTQAADDDFGYHPQPFLLHPQRDLP